MTRLPTRYAPVLLLFAVVTPAKATLATPLAEATPVRQDTAALRVSLVTIGPGSQIWEPYGHNAIWIRDARAGTSVLYNYGIFDSRQEGFLRRFLRGRMWYQMRGIDAERDLRGYMAADRTVWVQDLNLTPAQRTELQEFLVWNDRPENREYRYHYYFDNCSTRVRDALDRVLDGALRDQTATAPATATFRFHTQRLNTQNVPLYLGLMIGLGSPVDRDISVWEEMFLPLTMRDAVREVTVPAPDGRPRPLVEGERILYESTRPPPPDGPPAWTPRFALVSLAAAGLLLVLGWWGARSSVGRFGFAAVSVVWGLIVGTAGTTLAGLWLFTDHTTSYWNENLFQFQPLWIVFAMLVPFAAWGAPRAHRWAVLVALTVAGIAGLGFVIQILPGFDQVNGQLYALTLAPSLAVAIGVARLPARRRRAPAVNKNSPGG